MIRNVRGLSIVELMLAIGIFSVAMGIIFVPQLVMQKRMIENEKKAERIVQIDDIKQKMTSIEHSIDTSALVSPENDSLCPCTQGGGFISSGNKVCIQNLCQANLDTEFSFYSPNVMPLTKIAGTTASPVYYAADGQICQIPQGATPEATCAYKALTQFKAHCAGNLASCDHADYLIVTLELIPIGDVTKMAYEKTQILHTVPLNYNPKLTQVLNQTMVIGEEKKVAINADAGSPSENQGFIFEKCDSSAPAIVEVKCYRFINAVGQIILSSKQAGTAKITLQVNDGASTNFLSTPMTFDVTVTP